MCLVGIEVTLPICITYCMVINLQKVVLTLEAVILKQTEDWIFTSEI